MNKMDSMPIDEFIKQWIEGQVRKFAAEINEWEEEEGETLLNE